MDNYYAKINFRDHTPVAAEFDDIYFSTQSGIDETKHVFIKYNQLTKRFSQLQDNDIFVIGETGFGSGLNFLVTLNLWQQVVKTKAKLFFISFEKHPLSQTDMAQILSKLKPSDPIDDYSSNIQELLSQYYLPLPATHRLHFSNNIFLNIIIGDIQQTIPTQNFIANAWFLDGFTPTKNIDMWNDTVLNNIKRLSQTGSTFATFTANSAVRRLLIMYGFTVNKAHGFSKREMLYGSLDLLPVNNASALELRLGKINNRPTPWFDNYTNHNPDKKVIIIGGGISGAASAYSLARRGYKVTIYEQNNTLASGASGNYQGILYGNFKGHHTPIQELSFAGYRYSHQLITKLLGDVGNCGLIQLAHNEQELIAHQKITSMLPSDFCRLVFADEITQLSGVKTSYPSGLYFPYGLWLNPPSLINQLVSHPNIQIICDTKISDIVYRNDKRWDIVANNAPIDHAYNIVVCNADMLNTFSLFKDLSIRKIRGQVSIVKDKSPTQMILCGEGYITPNLGDKYTIGATFDFKNIKTTVTINDHLINLRMAQQIAQTTITDPHTLDGNAAIRASTYDYVPLVGPVANWPKFSTTYAKLSQDSNSWLSHKCPYLKGIYLNVAHGAKGMLTAPVSGEIIADYIDNTPISSSEVLRRALHPNRVYFRNLVKAIKHSQA